MHVRVTPNKPQEWGDLPADDGEFILDYVTVKTYRIKIHDSRVINIVHKYVCYARIRLPAKGTRILCLCFCLRSM